MVATLEAVVRLRDEMSGKLDALDKKVGSTSTGMKGLGKTMLGTAGGFLAAQASVTTLTSVVGASVGAAAKYEGQMAQIRALTGATKGDTDKLTDSIFEMTETLPKSPAELGAGAYFILSSGIKDTATATKVLELSAKASTIGLGDTKTVADALTSVMNAYQLSAEDAGRATDTLVNIVKFGKGEPAELAESLGFVIPVAAQMGIEFEQVGAVMATLTNTGLSAAESVTALRGIMLQILSPSDEAKKKFAALGINLEEFRAQIDDDFVGAMGRLVAATGGSETALAELFPEVRGLVGVMAAFGNQADQTRANLDGITRGTGALEEGMEEVSATAEHKYRVAMNNLNVTLMQLGAEGLPAVAEGAELASDGLLGLKRTIDEVLKSTGFDELHKRSEQLEKDTGFDLPKALKDGLIGSLETTMNTILDTLPVVGQFRDALDVKDSVEGAGRALGLFGGSADDASGKLDGYTLSAAEADRLQSDLVRSGDDAAGVVGDLGTAMAEAKRVADAEFIPGIKNSVIPTLSDLKTAADEARTRLFDMFKEPTQEEEEAEALLANYRLELLRIEQGLAPLTQAQKDYLDTLGLTGDEAAITELMQRGLSRADAEHAVLLDTQLIPKSQQELDLLRLTRDAAKQQADVKFAAAPSQAEFARLTGEEANALSVLNLRMADVSTNGAPALWGSIDGVRVVLGDATLAAAGFRDTLYSIPAEIKTRLDFDILQSFINSDPAGVAPIPNTFGSRVIEGARGFHGEVTRPTFFLAGEGSRRERVDITPEDQMRREHAGVVALAGGYSGGPRGGSAGGAEGGSVVRQEINLHAGIGVDRGAIKQAVREMWPELQREASRGW